jgi:uncharacterized membrane protein HdeD (DUF308 family)
MITVDEVTSNWWALAVRALAAILLGVLALMVPAVTLAALGTLFGAYALADGVFAIVTAVRGMRKHERWGWMLLKGIVGVIAGIFALLFPPLGALALTWLVAAWALATGVLEITAAITLRKVMPGEWLLLIAGILSVILAVLVAVFPGAGMVLLVSWVGAYALVYGFVTLAFAFRMKTMARAHG